MGRNKRPLCAALAGHAIWPAIKYNGRMSAYRWRRLQLLLCRGHY